MANNYFGFTHGGTQYQSAQQATAYPAAAAAAAQTAYVQPTAAAHQAAYATSTSRVAQAYDTYQTSHGATSQYAYAARSQQPTAVVPIVAAATPAVAQPAATYTVVEPAYQASKPVYTSSTYQQTSRQSAALKVQAPTAGYTYQSTAISSASSTSTSTTTYTGYDAALYSAATSYYQQQQGARKATTGSWYNKRANATNNSVGGFKAKSKLPAKQVQLHYCDVCKISCAGPQTYREHLEGQKHKKKEAASSSTSVSHHVGRGGQVQLKCELCDVACTGNDAYAAHIRGAKHQKVLKLHTKLGKPIPSQEPSVMGPSKGNKHKQNNSSTPAASVVKKTVVTPRITFVGGSQLKTTGIKMEEVKDTKPPVVTTATSANAAQAVAAVAEGVEDEEDMKDVVPVGHEYIEELKNEIGKVVSFNCKLCECKFNDPNAKEMHMKGRRHRLQYKKKVDPSLQVEVKPSIRARKLQEDKMRRHASKEEMWRRREREERWRQEMGYMEGGYYPEEMEYHYGGGSNNSMAFQGPAPGFMRRYNPQNMVRRPESLDDRHVMTKHTSIYPTEVELQSVQSIVSACEKALKSVSDHITEIDSIGVKVKTEPNNETPNDSIENKDKKEDSVPVPASAIASNQRVLKGVMRVGVLAKGLLLHGDLNVKLVVLCAEKPTRTLLERICDNLPKQLLSVVQNSEEENYVVKLSVEEAAIVVTSTKDPVTKCTITLTSPVMREEIKVEADGESSQASGIASIPPVSGSGVAAGGASRPDPPDVLDRQTCLEALASLRHAKWFQARATGLPSCVIVIRIMRDLCKRLPTWQPIPEWALELLVEKCVSTGVMNMGPGDALRRVFECVASGILLPAGPGLLDPCEKEPIDASAAITPQQKEDITASAQHALRLIAFRQIYKILGIDALPNPRTTRPHRFNPRKRRRSNSGNEVVEAADIKKEKKEEEGIASVSTAT